VITSDGDLSRVSVQADNAQRTLAELKIAQLEVTRIP
jgi:hypothetical protein